MADEKEQKKITDLPSASYVGDSDLFTIVQGGVATKTATTAKVGERINTAQSYSGLTTTSKNIVGAINELKEGGGASSFADLSDVSIDEETLANGQVPKYNSSTHKWENGTVSGGGGTASNISYDNTTSGLTADDVQEAIDELAQGGGGATSLNQLSDVTITSGTLADKQFLMFDSSSNLWINESYSPYADVTGTLTAGQTSITLSNNAITTSSTIEVFNDLDVPYNSKTVSTGSITLTFDAQLSDMSVKVRVS